MRSDDIGPCLGKGIDKWIYRRDHKVYVHHCFHVWFQRFDGRRTKGDVGHEMPVHHIDMDPIRALGFDRLSFLPEIGKIGRQDGRGDLDLTVERHGGTALLQVFVDFARHIAPWPAKGQSRLFCLERGNLACLWPLSDLRQKSVPAYCATPPLQG